MSLIYISIYENCILGNYNRTTLSIIYFLLRIDGEITKFKILSFALYNGVSLNSLENVDYNFYRILIPFSSN